MAENKFDELRDLLIGEDLKKFDTRFMEFGDKLRQIAQTAGRNDEMNAFRSDTELKIAGLNDKIAKLQKDVKMGFDRIIDTINVQFKKFEGEISKNAKEVEAVKKKFDGLKQLLAGS